MGTGGLVDHNLVCPPAQDAISSLHQDYGIYWEGLRLIYFPEIYAIVCPGCWDYDMVFIYGLIGLIYGISWFVPLPSNSDHQDCFMFRLGDPNLNLHLPLSLGGGQPNVCYTSSHNHGSQKWVPPIGSVPFNYIAIFH